MNPTVKLQLAKARDRYKKEGFNILGIFGSYARDEETTKSDVDILYELNEGFVDRYEGFLAFERLGHIREELQVIFGRDVDIAAKSGLSRTAKIYIFKDLYYA